jgi:hypothetical protein
MANKVTILKSETADAILKKKEQQGRALRQSRLHSENITTQINQEYIVAQVASEIKDGANKATGYYKMIEVIRQNNDNADFDNHEWVNQRRSFIAYEVGGTSGLSDADGAFVCFSTVATKNKSVLWNFRAGGGGSERSYVVITSVESASSYIGDVITSPDDATVITEGVAIKVENALSNAFDVGYSNFADKTKDGSGNDVYYLAALLLT